MFRGISRSIFDLQKEKGGRRTDRPFASVIASSAKQSSWIATALRASR